MGWVYRCPAKRSGRRKLSSESGMELQPKTDFPPPDLEIWPLCEHLTDFEVKYSYNNITHT